MPTWITSLADNWPYLFILALAGFLIWKLWNPMRKLFHFIDDVAGEPARPGHPERPGMMERIGALEQGWKSIESKVDELGTTVTSNTGDIATIKEQVGQVRHEVTTNHGSSLKDAVKFIGADVKVVEDAVMQVSEDLREHRQAMEEQLSSHQSQMSETRDRLEEHIQEKQTALEGIHAEISDINKRLPGNGQDPQE